jgi:WD40 repeat protein/tRNA A-37 threonylcarbamoyl transferase component Bud32
MICCLNSDCKNPICHDNEPFCPSCKTSLIDLKHRYHPIKPISAGGFGKTYLAQNLDRNRELCVIKQFAPQTLDERAIAKAKELFEREAMGLQQLGIHPQIPSLFDYFEEEGNLYLIQEYIEGQTLKEELNTEGIFDESKIYQVLEDLLGILAFVHQYSVIHRDIKPQNIMRRQDDRRLVLIDFGVSKQMTLTAIGKPATRIGSSGYVPREQMEMGDVSSNCDLYGIGATCFHLMTGVHPRQLIDLESYRWVQNWRQYLKQPISKELGFIFDKLLQMESRRRYQLVEQVLADFNKLSRRNLADDRTLIGARVKNEVDDDSTAIVPPYVAPTVIRNDDRTNIKARMQSWLCHPWARIYGGSALLLLVLAGTQFYSYYRYRLFPSNPLYVITAPSSEVFLRHTLKRDQGGVNVLLMTDNSQNQSLFTGGKNGAIERWNVATGKLVQTFKNKGDRILSLAVDREEKVLVSGDGGSNVSVWDVNSGEEKKTFTVDRGRIITITLTNDSKRAVIAVEGQNKTIDKNRLDIWDLSTGTVTATFTGDLSGILSLALSRDDRILVTGGIDRSLKIWNFQTQKLEKTLSSHTGYIETIAITPDNRLLVSGSVDRTLKIWNLQTGTLRQTLTGHDDSIKAVAISPDGEILVSAGVDRQIRFWQLKTGKLITTYLGYNNSIRSLAISPDGKTLASGGVDRPIELWQMP